MMGRDRVLGLTEQNQAGLRLDDAMDMTPYGGS
jgi:hypothetical protein